MSDLLVSINPPPTLEDEELQEWLARLLVQINLTIGRSDYYPPVGMMPERAENGMLVYFNQAILPDITAAGPWMYVEGTWKAMT